MEELLLVILQDDSRGNRSSLIRSNSSMVKVEPT